MPKICQHEGCNYNIFSHGFCRIHQRDRKDLKLPKTKPRKYILPVSPKQLERQKEYRRVRDFYMANHATCEGKIAGCTIIPTDLHHAFGKNGSLLTDTRYFKALCRHCHDYVHNHVAEARELGLLGKSTEGFIINKKAE